MKYLRVGGIILIVVGLGLIITSFIPLPSIEYVPKVEPREEYTYTTVRETWLEEEFVLSAGYARRYCGSFPDGTTLDIYIHVLSGGNRDINFWVMDEDEWTRFINRESFYYYVSPSRSSVTETKITWSPPANKRICFVYDNTFSLVASKNVYTKIDVTYNKYTTITTYTTRYVSEVRYRTMSSLLMPGIIILIIGIGLTAGGYGMKERGREEHPSSRGS